LHKPKLKPQALIINQTSAALFFTYFATLKNPPSQEWFCNFGEKNSNTIAKPTGFSRMLGGEFQVVARAMGFTGIGRAFLE